MQTSVEQKISFKTFHSSSYCYAQCIPTKCRKMSHRPVSASSNKTFVANVNIPVLLYAGFDVFVAITNPFHPPRTVTALYLLQPFRGNSFYCLYFNSHSHPTFHFIFVLFCLRCGQVGMPVCMYIHMDIYIFPHTHVRVHTIFGSFEYELCNTTIACV